VYESNDIYWSWKIIEQLCFSNINVVNRYINHLDFLFLNVQRKTRSSQKTSLTQFLLSSAGLKITTFPILANDQETIIVTLKNLIALVNCKSPEVKKSFPPLVMAQMHQAVQYIQKSIENHIKTHVGKFIPEVHKKNYDTICDLTHRFFKDEQLLWL